MIMNPHLLEAARATVRGRDQGGALEPVDGYPGMFVAESGTRQVRALHYYSEGDRRFVLGTLAETPRRV